MVIGQKMTKLLAIEISKMDLGHPVRQDDKFANSFHNENAKSGYFKEDETMAEDSYLLNYDDCYKTCNLFV